MSNALRGDAIGYWQRMRQFTPNAQKLIVSNVLRSFGWGISQTLFNLYLISLGYSNAFIGSLMSINAFTMAICSLIMGPFISRFGTKGSLVLASIILVSASLTQVIFPLQLILYVMGILNGLGQAMSNVAFGPFLTKCSTPYERTHLFGASQSAFILSSFFANTLAGIFRVFSPSLLDFPLIVLSAFKWRSSSKLYHSH